MITEIGIVAGEIWHFLDSNGEVNLTQLFSGIQRPRDWTLMSLGWLAREGHVIVIADNNNEYKIRLTEVEKSK